MSPAVERGEGGKGGGQIKLGENKGKERVRQWRGREGGKKGGKGKNKSLSGICLAPGFQLDTSVPLNPFHHIMMETPLSPC